MLSRRELIGKAAMGAAAVATLASNETTVADQVFTGLLPHAERVERFAADGKLR
jgi:hypothetical protein